jgi:phage-related minor tail protein
VIGAWQEAVDQLRRSRLTVPAAATPAETARAARAAFSESVAAVTRLSDLANAALFDHEEPSEQAVLQAWAWERELREELAARRRRTAGARPWARTSPPDATTVKATR